MLSAVGRYKLLLSGALARYFPRTTAYLRAEREAGLPQQKPRSRTKKAGAAAGKSATGKGKAGAGKRPARPRGKPGGLASTAIYGPALLAVDAAQVEAMRARVAQAVAAGVIIHESRFTYAAQGLVAVADLGQWWEETSGLPIPLGGILLRRDLPGVDPLVVQRVLRRTVAYALEYPDGPMGYGREHAQEIDDAVMRDHIGLYVNAFSRDLGDEGMRAVEALMARSVMVGLCPTWDGPLFPA